METYWLSNKEKFPGAEVSKLGHADTIPGILKDVSQLTSLKKMQL